VSKTVKIGLNSLTQNNYNGILLLKLNERYEFMKKLLALLMVALMAVSLAACVPTPGDINDIVNNALNDLENDIDSDTDLDINIGDDDNDVIVDIEDNNTDETSAVSFNGNITEKVVYNNNGIKVTVDEIYYKEFYGPTLSMLVENESDEDVTVSVEKLCINNIVFNSYFYAEVNSGKKVFEDMYFYDSDLTECGIESLGTIEFSFHIYESDSYDTIERTDMIKLVMDENVATAPVPKGDKLYSKNGVTVYTEECTKEDDDYYNYVTRLFVINETKEDISVSLEDVSVNGFMLDPYCSVSVPAGKMGYTNVYFYEDNLAENKIKEIEEVEFSLKIYNSESYDTIDESDAFTLKIK